jgi:hypothetical protein
MQVCSIVRRSMCTRRLCHELLTANRNLDSHAIDSQPTPPSTSSPGAGTSPSHADTTRNTHHNTFPSCVQSKTATMSLRKRILAAIAILEVSSLTLASPNLTAISLQSTSLNTSPFRLFDDRPADCPPWSVSLQRV